ncbi:conserved hypothetical protein [Teredinibacter turnerae T7901]|uniref:Uncharacterized protein n=1 Tax=Teredinibacter turnerae (strain ATCC 39867 / T7901) TaxID=377629 RepID=C5BT06_TERTT|nr:hypothetical protein [Teredinibacter turnerae]ACR10947.1 conserved hypothetical protein [Teredinibacter turnerae T7901]
MFNVSLKLREPKGLVVPEGPSFKWARTIRSEFEGTEIAFKAPKHSPKRSNHKGYVPERRYNESNPLTFRNYYDEEQASRGLPDHWREADFFYHSWAFNGPWFTGPVGELNLMFRLVRVVNYPKDMSLFHPRALEQVIGDYLTDMYSYHKSETRGGIQVFHAPINWQILTHLPVNAARMEVVSENFSPHRTIKRMVFFPISDDLMSVLIFWPSRLKNLPRSELDKRVNEKPILDLMEDIIASLKLNLSPRAKAQQEAALTGLEDTSLIKEYPPLKWDNVSEEEKQKILAAD